MSDDVVIGKFGRPHGVQGEVRFHAYNPESDLLAPGLRLRLIGTKLDGAKVKAVRRADKFDIVTLEGIHDRDAAERVRNAEVAVPRTALPPAGPDEFYLVDVIGFEVWGAARTGEERRLLGHVKGWLDIGPTEIMAVTGPEISGRLLVPRVAHVVEQLDFETGRVLLHPLDTWAPEEE